MAFIHQNYQRNCQQYYLLKKLKEYLKVNNYTQDKFIKELQKQTGHKLSQGGLSKYIIGQRTPRKEEMLIIYEFTNGEVQPNDFYNLQSEKSKILSKVRI